MAGYEPIDLAPVCNAGVHVLGEASADVPLGSVEPRGLPFLIGSEPVAKDRRMGWVRRWRTMRSGWRGGVEVVVPIRERFEIQVVGGGAGRARIQVLS